MLRSLLLTPFLLLATTGMAQDVNDVILEPSTGSLWLETGDVQNRRILGEWRADGTLERLPEPFGPFTYRHPRVLSAESPTQTGSLFGRFGVSAHYRGVYRRDVRGALVVEDLFADPAALGCAETPATAPCHMIGLFTDKRGLSGLVMMDQDGQILARYWDGTRYRAAEGIETQLGFTDLLYSELAWSPAGDAIFLPNTFTFDDNFSFTIVSAAGRAARALKIENTIGSPANLKLSTAGNGRRLLQRSYPTAAGSDGKTVVYVIDDPYGEAAALRKVATRTTGSENVSLLDADETHAYYQVGALIKGLAYAGGTESDVLDCGSPSFYAGTLLRRVPIDKGLWLYCGATLARIESGRVTWRADAEAPVRFGRMLADAADAFDIVVATQAGTVQRFRAGAPTVSALVSPVPTPGFSLTMTWEEASGPCGVQYLEVTDRRIVCRVGGAWTTRASTTTSGDAMPAPASVIRAGERTWAVSREDTLVRFFRLDDAGRRWTELAQLPWPTPSIYTDPRIVAFKEHVALDLGTEDLQVWTGSSLTSGYRHRRLATPFVAGFDGDGVLYDVCGTDDLGNERRLCRIQRDGQTYEYPLPLPRYIFDGRFVGLARGGLFVDYGTPYVLRGERVISLGRLYGEFQPIPNRSMSVSTRSAGEGAVVLQRRTFRPGNFDEPILDHYRFDGEGLQTLAFTPRRHRVSTSGGTVPGRIGFDIAAAWQGADGLWRAEAGGLTGLRYGWSPLDVQFSTTGDKPNDVRAALEVGSETVAATDGGLWSCPTPALTPVDADAPYLPATQGCRMRQAWPFVGALARDEDGLIVLQGRRVLRMAHLDDEAPETLSLSPTARALRAGEGYVEWIEGDVVVRYAEGVRTETPHGLAANESAELSHGFLCASSGLLSRGKKLLSSCRALAARTDHALATDGVRTYECDLESCADVGALPKPFLNDALFGTMQDGSFAAVLGRDLYVWASTWTPATPLYGRGSLLVARATRLENGHLSLLGGGTLTLAGGSRAPRHLRIE